MSLDEFGGVWRSLEEFLRSLKEIGGLWWTLEEFG